MMLAAIDFSEVWPIIATIVGVASGICSAAIWFVMQSLKEAIKSVVDRQQATESKQQVMDRELSALRERLSGCKVECERTGVSKEDYVREVGYSRRRDEMMIEKMARIETKIDVIERIPEITASITRAVIEQMKRGE